MRCRAFCRVRPRGSCIHPSNKLEGKLREKDNLAAAGEKWATEEQDLEGIFMQCLHSMFMAALRARKLHDDKAGLLFPVMSKNDQSLPLPRHGFRFAAALRGIHGGTKGDGQFVTGGMGAATPPRHGCYYGCYCYYRPPSWITLNARCQTGSR